MMNGPISVALRTEIMKHRNEYKVEEEGESEKVNKRTSVFPYAASNPLCSDLLVLIKNTCITMIITSDWLIFCNKEVLLPQYQKVFLFFSALKSRAREGPKSTKPSETSRIRTPYSVGV